ncbi:toxin-activating lysine-acyltransferase [Klebsiella sp. PL-2018]|uniref:toxin-activating lysine-acyltransferase n=1 Tax=Klebsiella sp. PL-2018 TaxID=2851540 RepID=UPI001C2242D2|nr:toxin-activating lysine-acyltransferase [Klebsiella sp. PL-2018]QXD01369.1 hypothetical protein MKleb_5868 [Klebsiella sp. PL-2018]HCZ9102477.1 toxin-activating lysine-acyltransferase [Klebsiella michiganensis]
MSIQYWRKKDEQKAMQLGAIASVIARHPMYGRCPANWLGAWIFNALEHQQAYVYFRSGLPVGFMTWAFLQEETLARLIYSDYVLHWSEWSEGDYLWLVDFCMLEALSEPELIELLSTVFAGYRTVYWCSRQAKSQTIYRLHIDRRHLSVMDSIRFVELLGQPTRESAS